MIPEGIYCNGCTFHDIDDELSSQENGYCHYLKKNDIELSNERMIRDSNDKIISQKDKDDLPFVFSLLWDGCKECDINKCIGD